MAVDLTQLTIAERIQLVEDLWDTIIATPEAVPLNDAQRAELDRRLAAYRASPADGRSWAEVKAALLRRSLP
jgi:putative addiction module component (TIGR02574 family)